MHIMDWRGCRNFMYRFKVCPEIQSKFIKYLKHRSCQLHTTKSMEGPSFHNVYTQKGKYTKRLAYTALVRPIFEYGAVC